MLCDTIIDGDIIGGQLINFGVTGDEPSPVVKLAAPIEIECNPGRCRICGHWTVSGLATLCGNCRNAASRSQ